MREYNKTELVRTRGGGGAFFKIGGFLLKECQNGVPKIRAERSQNLRKVQKKNSVALEKLLILEVVWS